MKKKALVAGTASKAFTSDVYDITEIDRRQVSQAAAEYSALGAKGNKGCATCQWFISPNSCILVSGDISPTGISKFYTAESDVVDAPTPLPVYIVENKEQDEAAPTEVAQPVSTQVTTKNKPLSAFKALFDFFTGSKSNKAELRPFWVVKGSGDESWRVFMVYSNQFKDKDTETIPEAAHLEYIDWADEHSIYPEYHLWHAGPGSKWGQADFLAYSDGFAMSSGLVDKGKEYVAEALEELAQKKELKVSHGFYGLKDTHGVYLLYRGFEQSPLPVGAEANPWTGVAFNVFENKELEMPFSEAKRAFLKNVMKVGDSQIAEMESAFKDMGESLKAHGVEFKEQGTEPATGETAALATVVAEFKGVAEAIKGLSDGLGAQITTTNATVAAQGATLDELSKQVKELAEKVGKTQDELVADAYKAAAAKAAAQPFVASEQAGSTVATKEGNKGPGDQDWFGATVIDPLVKTPMVGAVPVPTGGGTSGITAPDPAAAAAAALGGS